MTSMLAACVWSHSVHVQMSRVSRVPRSSTLLASYPGHVQGGKSGLVSTVRACATTPWFYEVLYTVVNKLLTFSANTNLCESGVSSFCKDAFQQPYSVETMTREP